MGLISLENMASGPRGAPASDVSNMKSGDEGATEDAWKDVLARCKSADPTIPRTPAEPPETPQQDHKWTPATEAGIKSLIAKALSLYHGNVSEAFAYVRDQREKPSNFYNSNMAIADDYLRSRWDAETCGPAVALGEVNAYMTLKQHGLVPKSGPGPVSPYSPLELQFMKQGVWDQTRQMPLWEQYWWTTPGGAIFGYDKAEEEIARGLL